MGRNNTKGKSGLLCLFTTVTLEWILHTATRRGVSPSPCTQTSFTCLGINWVMEHENPGIKHWGWKLPPPTYYMMRGSDRQGPALCQGPQWRITGGVVTWMALAHMDSGLGSQHPFLWLMWISHQSVKSWDKDRRLLLVFPSGRTRSLGHSASYLF